MNRLGIFKAIKLDNIACDYSGLYSEYMLTDDINISISIPNPKKEEHYLVKSSVCICGCAKNIEKYLNNTFKNYAVN